MTPSVLNNSSTNLLLDTIPEYAFVKEGKQFLHELKVFDELTKQGINGLTYFAYHDRLSPVWFNSGYELKVMTWNSTNTVVITYNFATPYTLSSYTGYSYVVYSPLPAALQSVSSMGFSVDGMRLYYTTRSSTNTTFNKYDLPSPFNVGNLPASPTQTIMLTGQTNSSILGATRVSPDGLSILILRLSDRVERYGMTVAHDLSTLTGATSFFSASANSTATAGFCVTNDAIYVADHSSSSVGDGILKYSFASYSNISGSTYQGAKSKLVPDSTSSTFKKHVLFSDHAVTDKIWMQLGNGVIAEVQINVETMSGSYMLQDASFVGVNPVINYHIFDDGKRLAIVDSSDLRIYSSTVPYLFDSNTVTLTSQEALGRADAVDVFVSTSNRYVYVAYASASANVFVQRIAYDAAWATATPGTTQTFNIKPTNYLANVGLFLSKDGLKLCLNSTYVYTEYDLGVPWDITTAIAPTYAPLLRSIDLEAAKTSLGGTGSYTFEDETRKFTADGTKMYMVTKNTLNQLVFGVFTLTTPGVPYPYTSVTLSPPLNQGLDFVEYYSVDLSPDGTQLIITSTLPAAVYQFTLSTPFNASTLSGVGLTTNYFSPAFSVSNNCRVKNAWFTPDGLSLITLERGAAAEGQLVKYSLNDPYQIAGASLDAQSTQYVNAFEISPDGTKALRITYAGGVFNLEGLTFGTAWDITSMTVTSTYTEAGTPLSYNSRISTIAPDGSGYILRIGTSFVSKKLATAWDASTVIASGPDYTPTITTGWDPAEIWFNNTGSKAFFAVDSNLLVVADCSTPFTITNESLLTCKATSMPCDYGTWFGMFKFVNNGTKMLFADYYFGMYCIDVAVPYDVKNLTSEQNFGDFLLLFSNNTNSKYPYIKSIAGKTIVQVDANNWSQNSSLYTLNTAWTIGDGISNSKPVDVYTTDGLIPNADGSEVMHMDNLISKTHFITCSTPGDISSFFTGEYYGNGYHNFPTWDLAEVQFFDNGAKVFIYSNGMMATGITSVAYSLKNVTWTNSATLPGGDTLYNAVIADNGTYFYTLYFSNSIFTVSKYSFGTPWDISTISYVGAYNAFPYVAPINSPSTGRVNMSFDPSGYYVFFSSNSGRRVRIKLATPWNIFGSGVIEETLDIKCKNHIVGALSATKFFANDDNSRVGVGTLKAQDGVLVEESYVGAYDETRSWSGVTFYKMIANGTKLLVSNYDHTKILPLTRANDILSLGAPDKSTINQGQLGNLSFYGFTYANINGSWTNGGYTLLLGIYNEWYVINVTQPYDITKVANNTMVFRDNIRIDGSVSPYDSDQSVLCFSPSFPDMVKYTGCEPVLLIKKRNNGDAAILQLANTVSSKNKFIDGKMFGLLFGAIIKVFE